MEVSVESLFEELRYVVLGLFDGVLTALGIVVASHFSGASIGQVLDAGLAGGFAVSLSNGFGAYFAEEAEMGKRLKLIEKGVFRELRGTKIYERYRKSVHRSLITHSLSTFLGSVILLSVFCLTENIYITSGAMFIILFLLGSFIGKWGYSHILISGLKLVGVGALVATLSLLLGSF